MARAQFKKLGWGEELFELIVGADSGARAGPCGRAVVWPCGRVACRPGARGGCGVGLWGAGLRAVVAVVVAVVVLRRQARLVTVSRWYCCCSVSHALGPLGGSTRTLPLVAKYHLAEFNPELAPRHRQEFRKPHPQNCCSSEDTLAKTHGLVEGGRCSAC